MIEMPSYFNGIGEGVSGLVDDVQDSMKTGLLSTTDKGLFGVKNIGSTVQGLGSLAGSIGSYMAMNKQADYQDKLFNKEEERIKKAEAKQDKFDKGMANSFA